MKTKTRNRLSTEALTGLLHTKQLIKGKSYFDFTVTKPLLKRVRTGSMYDQKKVEYAFAICQYSLGFFFHFCVLFQLQLE